MQYKNTKIQLYLPIVLVIIFIIGVLFGSNFFNHQGGMSKFIHPVTSGGGNNFNDILQYINNSYVDTVNTERLKESSIQSMLESLDPHSAYIPARDFNEANDPLMGNFQGIGIEFRLLRDTVIVMNVIPGGPSAKVGLRSGDKIITVNGKNIAGIHLESNGVVKLLKGPKDTKVNVGIKRSGSPSLLPFTIIRDVIPLYSIDTYYMLNKTTGYIKVTRFAETTADEFHNALIALIKTNMRSLVIDLRGNSGGMLDAAIRMADELLDNKKLIVFTKGRKRAPQYSYATKEGTFEDGKLTILIDEFSASASEILAGAIQDNDRGLIIGRRTFGKGLVQEQMQLPDGSAIRLTVARYYTPSGRCIQRSYAHGAEEYYTSFYKRMASADSTDENKKNPSDTVTYKTLKSRKVFGGGGIHPDINIPVKADKRYHFYNQLFDKGILYQYAFDYIESHKKELAVYKTSNSFIQSFSINNIMYNDMISRAIKNKLEATTAEVSSNQKELCTQLKALIGRQLYDENTFYKILNQNDEFILKALQ